MDELDDWNPAEDARRAWHAKRLEAVRLLQAGHAPATVASALGVASSTVRGWLGRYRRGGLDALAVGKPPGRQRAAPNRVCERCGKAFHARPYFIRRGQARYCSAHCRWGGC